MATDTNAAIIAAIEKTSAVLAADTAANIANLKWSLYVSVGAVSLAFKNGRFAAARKVIKKLLKPSPELLMRDSLTWSEMWKALKMTERSKKEFKDYVEKDTGVDALDDATKDLWRTNMLDLALDLHKRYQHAALNLNFEKVCEGQRPLAWCSCRRRA